MAVEVSSELPLSGDEVSALVRKPALLAHVCAPVLTFPDLPPGPFAVGDEVSVALRLFGVLPLWRHTIRIAEVEGHRAVTEERGGPLRRWRHTVSAVPLGPRRCRYTDTVELDAGPFTPVATPIARAFYRHRHRRWRALARVLA